MINSWNKLNKEIIDYLEKNILPNLLAFSLTRIYFHNYNNLSYDEVYNTVKTYINLVNERKNMVTKITINILKEKYRIKVINFNPIILEIID